VLVLVELVDVEVDVLIAPVAIQLVPSNILIWLSAVLKYHSPTLASPVGSVARQRSRPVNLVMCVPDILAITRKVL